MGTRGKVHVLFLLAQKHSTSTILRGRWRSASMTERQPSTGGRGSPTRGTEGSRADVVKNLGLRTSCQGPRKAGAHHLNCTTLHESPDPSVKKQDANGARDVFLECSKRSELLRVVSRIVRGPGQSSGCVHTAVAMGTRRAYACQAGRFSREAGVLRQHLLSLEGWPLLQGKSLENL